ncbi:hypothetical protein DFP72DRAFT_892953 [Ephemerocybe angulata]|uniref:HMG box domain-containing protein n=1 Tax=Ephemerocybe angulata TaxID=980116 RepID=A0A8H6M9H5_9AGAR|nr:hypothetical protein DFP72DRAFT_892953 [Tulosesus angulatus]
MPADRSNSMTTSSWSVMNNDMSCHQLVWTAPVAAAPRALEYTFESTAQITEIDFDDGPPPLVDAPPLGALPPPPSQFILFPPPDSDDPFISETGSKDKAVAKRSPHSKKKPENHIPRPPNAFILFRSSFIKQQHVSQEVETNHSTLSKIIGLTWKNLSDNERKNWHDKAKTAQEEHRRKFPKYAFRPQQTKGAKGGGGAGAKRKVREVEPKDSVRCAKIAELLVQGKKGSELQEEIAEFDKHHIPEIITRFEAPITEKAFRRSSSAPVEETELTIEQQSFLPKEKPAKKVRSVSQRPTRCPTPLVVAQPQPQQHTQQSQMMMQSPLKEEATYDFSTFSFENVAPNVYNGAGDPLVENYAVNMNVNLYASANDGLHIDTSSYIADQWSQCSSPMTPESTPEFFASTPSPSPVESYAASPADSFGQQVFDKQYNNGFNQLQYPVVYQQDSNDAFLNMAGDYGFAADLSMEQFQVDNGSYAAYSQVPQFAY